MLVRWLIPLPLLIEWVWYASTQRTARMLTLHHLVMTGSTWMAACNAIFTTRWQKCAHMYHGATYPVPANLLIIICTGIGGARGSMRAVLHVGSVSEIGKLPIGTF